MSVSQVTLIYALLAVAGALFLFWLGVLAIASRFSDSVADSLDTIRERLAPYALPGAFTVALLAVVGSLYFSEIAQFEPCRLCWYQRIAMGPVALIGLVISSYHYLLEWFPAVDTGACKVGIPCTVVWFRELGFVSLPFLALTAFALIIALLLIPPRVRAEDDAEA